MAFRYLNPFERKVDVTRGPVTKMFDPSTKKDVDVQDARSVALTNQFSGMNLQGTKWSRYGKRPEGLASTLDSEIMSREINKERENWGDGFVTFQMLGADGNPSAGKPLNLGGRMFYGDASGKFTVVDEAFLDKMVDIENEKREYLKSLIVKASVSDDVCSLMLGVPDCKTLLGPGADGGSRFTKENAPDIFEVDARPSAIETYDENSITYSRAALKFKTVLKDRMPIVSELTNKKAENAD